jgi:putative membrane protein
MLKTYLKGLLMGLADLVPGISGGTIALITNIYDELIKSISDIVSFPSNFIKKDFKAFEKINFYFLIPLFLGIITAIFLGAKIISYLLLNYPAQTYSLFVGIIIASIVFLSKKYVTKKTGKISFGIGTLIGLILSFMVFTTTAPSFIGTFFLGFFAIIAMILPGISGSYILLMLGQYEYVINLVSNFPQTILLVSLFAVGCLLGLLIFSKLINYLLKKYSTQTHSLLIGLMFGTLIVPIKLILENNPNYLALIALVLGLLSYVLLENYSK